MLPYRLPISNNPDYIMVLAAMHAEAFNRASRAAATYMGAIKMAQGSFAIIRSQTEYQGGAFDLKTCLVNAPVKIDDLTATAGRLEVDHSTASELRKQLMGHVRAALADASRAGNHKSLFLLFHKTGPLLIFRDEGPEKEFINTPYRIGVLRFEGATSMAEEQFCVEANNASMQAFHDLWFQLDEQIRQEQATGDDVTTDILDDPDVRVPKALPAIETADRSLEDEEDMIDGLPGEFDDDDGALPDDEFDRLDNPDNDGDGEASVASSAPAPADADVSDSDFDTAGLPF